MKVPAHIPILYEDNHLIVVVKPCNIPSQSDESHDVDLLSLLKANLKQRYQKPGEVYLGLVHRLDRPTGGVMVFAKTSKAASRISESIRTQKFEKQYLAVVHGKPLSSQRQLRHWLAKHRSESQVLVVNESTPHSQEALLDYQVLATHESLLSLVKINLHTGRKHQIRVQFSAIGHPLWGDQKYGSHVNQSGQQLALWSHSIAFSHPTRQEWMCFHSHPPSQAPWTLWPAEIIHLTE